MVHLIQDRIHVSDRAVVTLSQPASVLAADATLDDALHVLLKAGVRHLVVVAPDGRFVGVLRSRQRVGAWAGRPDTVAVTPVTALLDTAPIVTPTATARMVACVMRDYGSDVVVVVGQDRAPVGVVTAGDLVAAIADSG